MPVTLSLSLSLTLTVCVRSEHSWPLVKKLLKVPKNFHLRRSSHDNHDDQMPALFPSHSSSSSASMDSGATMVVDTTNRGVMVDNSISSSLSPIHEIREERKLPLQPPSSSASSLSPGAAYSTPLIALSSLDTTLLPMGAVPSMPATPMIAGSSNRPLSINTNAFLNHFHLLPTHDGNGANSVPLLADAAYTTSAGDQQNKVEGHGSIIRLFPLHRRSPKTNNLRDLDGNRSPSESRGGERKLLSFLNTIFHPSNSPKAQDKAQDSHASPEEGAAHLKPLHGILKTPKSSILPSDSASIRGRSSSSPALPRGTPLGTPLSVKGGKESASASTASSSLSLSHPNTPLGGSRSSMGSILLPPLSPPSQQSSVTTATTTTTTTTPAAAPYTFARCQSTYFHNLHSDQKKHFQQRQQRMRSLRGRLLVGGELEDAGVSKWEEEQDDQGKHKQRSFSSSYYSDDSSPPTRLSLEKEDSYDSDSDSERYPTRKYFDTSALHQYQLSDQDSSSIASSSSTCVTHQPPPPLLSQGSLQKLHSFVSLVAQRASKEN